MGKSVWAGRAILVAFAGWLILPPILMTDGAAKKSAAPKPLSGEQRLSPTTTRAVEQIRVGERVLAENPEVDDGARMSRPAPDWADWVHLSMQLPLPSIGSGIVEVELLRPESWLRDHLGVVLSVRPPVIPTGGSAIEAEGSMSSEEFLAPLRGVFHDLAVARHWYESIGYQTLCPVVELDLAEMGIVGTAVVTGIKPCPVIRAGLGQVVTGTFAHPPSQQVLNVWFEGETLPIGVTSNHPFWSVDRQQFVAIGAMPIGERVRTVRGESKRVEQKLPRPGPQVVHNLEVYGEHVYHVGRQGLLAHNAYAQGVGGRGAYKQSASHLRNSMGIAQGGSFSKVDASGIWFRGTHGSFAMVPGQVAEAMRGRAFESFSGFRIAFWKSTADFPELTSHFSNPNVIRMRAGFAPIAQANQHHGELRSLILHHRTPIHAGGGVYDLGNLLIVTPKFHQSILDHAYHFGR